MSTMLLKSSIAKKIAMSLSALFLIIFLLQHLVINLTTLISEDSFNEMSHFMGTNPLVQYVFQPVLMFGVVFHFIMGFVLEAKNWKARPVKYAYEKASANASWMSRNMIWSGLFILGFILFHLNDFWIPEIAYKYIEFKPEDPTRYYHEVIEMFHNPMRVAVYCLSFIFLALHLWHGFQSAFQSMGARHSKYTPIIELTGRIYSIIVPLGFIIIALYHYATQH